MRIRLFLLVIAAFACISIQAQRSPEAVGMQIVKALSEKDFKLIQSMSPDQDLVAKLMKGNEGEESKPQIQPETAYKMMQEKMRNEFDDMLKSAKFHKVKLAKLGFEKIESEEENTEAAVPMKALQMIMKCRGKQFRLSYAIIEDGGNWYYIGTLLSMDVFRPLEN
jgi:hypothetical protein